MAENNVCYGIWLSNCAEDNEYYEYVLLESIYVSKDQLIADIRNALSDGRFDRTWIVDHIHRFNFQSESAIKNYQFIFNEEYMDIRLHIETEHGEIDYIPFWIQKFELVT